MNDGWSCVTMTRMTSNDLAASIEDFDRCVIDRDELLALQVLDGEYALVLVHPAPTVVPRERWLDVLPDYIVHAYDVDQRHVDIDGDCAAVLQRVQMKATVLGEDRSGTFLISDVWRRRADGWRIWRRHSSPFTAGVMPGN
jgi:hypothetical protein